MNEAQGLAVSILDDTYRDSLWRRAVAGTLPPEVEVALWQLASGTATKRAVVRPTLTLVRGEDAKPTL